MRENLISIIIPTYNRVALIGETLDSILEQTYVYWECIVVDDGSTDESEKVVNLYHNKDKRITFYKRPKSMSKGANTCRNYGLELSKGKYVNWFDSDDLMHPDKLQLQVMTLEKSNLPFCVCQSYIFEGSIDNVLGLKSKRIISDNPFDDFLCKKNIWLTQAPVFKRTFLINNNYNFDEDLQAGQEWELFTRILFDYSEYDTIDKPLLYIRKHEHSISRANDNKQLWYYFLARYKIYNYLYEKLSKENKIYLKQYFLLVYKLFLRQSAFKESFKVWKMVLISDRSFTVKQHFFLIASFFSFYLFKKGDFFLTKVNRWDIAIKEL